MMNRDRAIHGQGAHSLSAVPLPRRMASRPVDCIAATMADGAAVPRTWTSWLPRSALTEWMPVTLCREEDMSRIHASQLSGTAKMVYGWGISPCERGVWVAQTEVNE